ncbi:MAG: M48 family metalloprotease [Candidatus Aminicenantes bacterium]|nr:M48 family metalloprotease [Candidatus Aminicenantes bacterium]
MAKNFARDFYDIQRQQWKKSLFLLIVLFAFYFLAIGLVSAVFIISITFFLSARLFPSGNFFTNFILINAGLSIFIAFFHFYDARKFGARFILKRLGASPPDSSDRYHKRFVNTVEEIRIASGLPKVTPYIIPQFAVNSLALVGSDKTPMILVTEGLLGEYTRDELQTVIAHELAHIIRGDAFYITLVCSLANMFERLREALEPDDSPPGGAYDPEARTGGPPLLYFAATFSSIIMHLLSMLISREREILADAAAVELSRNPRALARAIYKAHLKNSFVGDFNLTYSPLFIVPPESTAIREGFLGRLFNSHPPLMKRIRLLADMTKTKPVQIIEDVWRIRRAREKARTTLYSPEEARQGRTPSAQPSGDPSPQAAKIWSIRDPKGTWQGPYSIEELLFLRIFTPMIWIKNLQERIEAPAREFPQIRTALRNLAQKKPIDPARQNRCPRCRLTLGEDFYEGVALKTCRRCRGKLVDAGVMERIITRKEVAFSDHIIKKAKDFEHRFMQNPFLTAKAIARRSSRIFCPNCGSRMLPRPYTYQYIIPVDKCLSCHKIWFDTDELEIVQILTEKK